MPRLPKASYSPASRSDSQTGLVHGEFAKAAAPGIDSPCTVHCPKPSAGTLALLLALVEVCNPSVETQLPWRAALQLHALQESLLYLSSAGKVLRMLAARCMGPQRVGAAAAAAAGEASHCFAAAAAAVAGEALQCCQIHRPSSARLLCAC